MRPRPRKNSNFARIARAALSRPSLWERKSAGDRVYGLAYARGIFSLSEVKCRRGGGARAYMRRFECENYDRRGKGYS